MIPRWFSYTKAPLSPEELPHWLLPRPHKFSKSPTCFPDQIQTVVSQSLPVSQMLPETLVYLPFLLDSFRCVYPGSRDRLASLTDLLVSASLAVLNSRERMKQAPSLRRSALQEWCAFRWQDLSRQTNAANQPVRPSRT